MNGGSLFRLMVIALVACGISSCGNKGKLKSPSQIEYNDAKQAKRDQKKNGTADESPDDDNAPDQDDPQTPKDPAPAGAK